MKQPTKAGAARRNVCHPKSKSCQRIAATTSTKPGTLLELHLSGRQGLGGGIAENNRGCINAAFCFLRTNAPWRDLRPDCGDWEILFAAFADGATKVCGIRCWKCSSMIPTMVSADCTHADISAEGIEAGYSLAIGASPIAGTPSTKGIEAGYSLADRECNSDAIAQQAQLCQEIGITFGYKQI
jgi:hypothetical protein